MNNSIHFRIWLVCCVICFMFVGTAQSKVGVGSTRAEVIAEFGKPMGNTVVADKEVMLYKDGKTIELVDGKVSQMSGVRGAAARPAKPAPAVGKTQQPGRTRRTAAVPAEAQVIRKGDLKSAAKLEPEGEGVTARDQYGNTMLHKLPRQMARGYTAERLVSSGADMNAKNMFGQTPLHMCASENWQPRAELLLQNGADINAKDNFGKTPLHYAELYYRRVMSVLLREKGADAKLKDKSGATASDIRYEQKGWTLTQKGESRESAFRSVCYGNDRFVAVGDNGRIFLSSDGVEWTDRSAIQSKSFSSVDHVNGQFMAGAGWGKIAVSADGVTWTVTELEGAPRSQITGICYGLKTYVAATTSGDILVSRNGTEWESRSTGERTQLSAPCCFKNDFFAVDRKGRLFKSEDGDSWEKYDLNVGDLAIKGIANLRGTLFVFGENGLILMSKNGTKWTEATTERHGDVHDMTYGDNMYVAVGDRGMVWISKNGKSWMARNLHVASEAYGICHGNGAFVALTYAGIMTWRPSATVVPRAKDRPELELREFLDGLTSPEDGVRRVSQRELMLVGEAALGPAIAMVKDPQKPEVARKAAVRILGRVGGQEAAAVLATELTNLSSSVRMDVAQALVHAKHPVSVDALMQVLDADDYSPELRSAKSRIRDRSEC